MGKPEGKRPLGRPRRKWDNIKLNLGEVACDPIDWTNVAEGRDEWRAYTNAVMNPRAPIRP